MRTLSLPAKLITYCAGCVAVLYALTLPWYGAAGGGTVRTGADGIKELDGSFFQAVWRWISDPAGVTGSSVLHGFATALTVLVALGFLGALLSAMPATEQMGRTVLNLAAWGVIAVVAYKLVDQPGKHALVETRHGSLLALVGGVVMLSSSTGAAATRTRKDTPGQMSALHSPGLVDGHAPGSTGPPGR